MALSSDSAYVQVNVKYRVEGLKEAERQTRRAGKSMLDFGKILKQVALSTIAFKAFNTLRQGAMDLTKALVTTNADFEKFRIQLKVFTGSSKKAGELMGFLEYQSTRLAGGLTDMMQAATALATFGLDVKKWLEPVADVANATGRSLEDVAQAFGRVVAGDPRTKQFLVTRRANLGVFQRTLESSGGDREAALLKSIEHMTGLSAEMQDTFWRLAEQIRDLGTVAAKVAGEPLFEWMVEGMKAFRDVLEDTLYDEQNKRKAVNFFTEVGNAMRSFLETLSETWAAVKFLAHSLNALANPFSSAASKMGSYKEMAELLAPHVRKNLTMAWTEGKGGPGDSLGFFGFGEGMERDARKAYRKRIFEFLGMDPTTGFTEREQKEMWDEAIKKAEQEQRDRLREAKFKLAKIDEKLAKSREDILNHLYGMGRKRVLKATGKDIGEKRDMKKMLMATQELLPAPVDEEFTIPPEWDPDVMEARLKAQLRIDEIWFKHKWALEDKLNKNREQAREDALQKEQEAMQRRFEMARELTDRAVGELGFILFGGRNANAAIDRQVEAIQREIDVMNGVTAPLTRQEELMNRIVELEAQRITLADRLKESLFRVTQQLAEAAAKAALMRMFGFGTAQRGQSGGFLGLLGGFLGLIPHPAAQAASLGLRGMSGGGGPGFQNAIGPGGQVNGGGIGIQSGFEGGNIFGNPVDFGPFNISASKPVVVQNPIFLSNDVRGVAEKFAEEANRRMK